MSRLVSLVTSVGSGFAVSDETWSPLIEDDQLQEAELVDFVVDVATSTVGLLFELGTALQLREGSTGLLVVRQATVMKWQKRELTPPRHAWYVMSSLPQESEDMFQMRLLTFPDSEIVVSGAQADFYELDLYGGDPLVDDSGRTDAADQGWSSPKWPQQYELRNYWTRAGTRPA
jgi:hypothetical protein